MSAEELPITAATGSKDPPSSREPDTLSLYSVENDLPSEQVI